MKKLSFLIIPIMFLLSSCNDDEILSYNVVVKVLGTDTSYFVSYIDQYGGQEYETVKPGWSYNGAYTQEKLVYIKVVPSSGDDVSIIVQIFIDGMLAVEKDTTGIDKKIIVSLPLQYYKP